MNSSLEKSHELLTNSLNELISAFPHLDLQRILSERSFIFRFIKPAESTDYQKLYRRLEKLNSLSEQIDFAKKDFSNPEHLLKEIADELLKSNPKRELLNKLLKQIETKKYLICRKSDKNHLEETVNSSLVQILSFQELHQRINELENRDLLIYSIFNLDEYKFLHSIEQKVHLCFYPWEVERIELFKHLYNELLIKEKHSDARKNILEHLGIIFEQKNSSEETGKPNSIPEKIRHELTSPSLKKIFEYEDRDFQIHEQKVEDSSYENFNFNMKITFDSNECILLNSSETVFTDSNERLCASELIETMKVRAIGNNIDIVEEFNLFNNQEIIEISQASQFWKNVLKEALWKLKAKYTGSINCYKKLHTSLLETFGLQVEEKTLKGWIDNKKTWFPQNNADLEAIALYEMKELNKNSLFHSFEVIKEAKKKYDDYTKKLGFKFRDELENFLKYRFIEQGELLYSKFGNNNQQVMNWIEEEFPLKRIKKIEFDASSYYLHQ